MNTARAHSRKLFVASIGRGKSLIGDSCSLSVARTLVRPYYHLQRLEGPSILCPQHADNREPLSLGPLGCHRHSHTDQLDPAVQRAQSGCGRDQARSSREACERTRGYHRYPSRTTPQSHQESSRSWSLRERTQAAGRCEVSRGSCRGGGPEGKAEEADRPGLRVCGLPGRPRHQCDDPVWAPPLLRHMCSEVERGVRGCVHGVQRTSQAVQDLSDVKIVQSERQSVDVNYLLNECVTLSEHSAHVR